METIPATLPADRHVKDALNQARRRLQASPYSEVRRLKCDIEGRVLRLGGSVSRFHLKQIAQHLVRDLSGFDSVENCVTVTPRLRDAS